MVAYSSSLDFMRVKGILRERYFDYELVKRWRLRVFVLFAPLQFHDRLVNNF